MYTEETLSILDEIEDLSDMIVQSKVYFNYREAQKHLNKMMKHIYCIKLFKIKERYDEVMRFVDITQIIKM